MDTGEQNGNAPVDVKTLPRRFRTAFILFSSARHKEIRKQMGQKSKNATTADIAKIVSNDWNSMSEETRKIWEGRAQNDKERFVAEMSAYNENMRFEGRSAMKIPKRPMSAFLAFSNERRAALKRMNPDATNAELSKLLSKAWKEADPHVKAKYIDEEASLRAQYNMAMKPWRHKKPRKPKTVLQEERERIREENQRLEPFSTAGLGFDVSVSPGAASHSSERNMQNLNLLQQEQAGGLMSNTSLPVTLHPSSWLVHSHQRAVEHQAETGLQYLSPTIERYPHFQGLSEVFSSGRGSNVAGATMHADTGEQDLLSRLSQFTVPSAFARDRGSHAFQDFSRLEETLMFERALASLNLNGRDQSNASLQPPLSGNFFLDSRVVAYHNNDTSGNSSQLQRQRENEQADAVASAIQDLQQRNTWNAFVLNSLEDLYNRSHGPPDRR